MANTFAYEFPLTGSTPPTIAAMRSHSLLQGVATGDGATTTLVITHNFNLSAAEVADGFPLVDFESILAAGNTAAPIVSAKTATTITLTVAAFTGAGLRVRMARPHTEVR